MQDWYAAEAAKNEENGQNGQLKNVQRAKFQKREEGADFNTMLERTNKHEECDFIDFS